MILSSDHGEALAGSHGFYFSHAGELTEDQIQVPLLLYFPGCSGGRQIPRPVGTVDILPTAMAILGLPAPQDVDGVNLLLEVERALMSETPREVAVREGSWKLRWSKRSGARRLVDLAADPDEARNALGDARPRARMLERRFQQFQSRARLGTPLLRNKLSEEQREQLKALGYGAQ